MASDSLIVWLLYVGWRWSRDVAYQRRTGRNPWHQRQRRR